MFIKMDGGTEISVTIAQVVQRLRGTHLHSQLEKQAKVSRLAHPELSLRFLVFRCLSTVVQ